MTLRPFSPNSLRSALVAVALGLLALAGASPAAARTKLVALPERASLQFNLEHPHASLAVEERVLPLNRGLNRIDFSWQGVSIDPSSIQLEMISSPEEVVILNVTYPPNENALVWELSSPSTREERVRISYLLSGIAREIAYRLVADGDERHARMEVYWSLANHSGETLDDATIVSNWPEAYTKTLETGETRKIAVLTADKLPIRKEFILKPHEQAADGEMKYRPRMYYTFRNDEASGLGRALLPYGKYRIFTRDPQGSTIFTGEDWGKELPPNEKQELFLGVANDLVVRRVVFNTERLNTQRNSSRRIVSFDERVTVRYEIENFRKDAGELTIEERIDDYWRFDEFRGDLKPATERKTNEEWRMTMTVPPTKEGKPLILDFVYTRLNQVQ